MFQIKLIPRFAAAARVFTSGCSNIALTCYSGVVSAFNKEVQQKTRFVNIKVIFRLVGYETIHSPLVSDYK